MAWVVQYTKPNEHPSIHSIVDCGLWIVSCWRLAMEFWLCCHFWKTASDESKPLSTFECFVLWSTTTSSSITVLLCRRYIAFGWMHDGLWRFVEMRRSWRLEDPTKPYPTKRLPSSCMHACVWHGTCWRREWTVGYISRPRDSFVTIVSKIPYLSLFYLVVLASRVVGLLPVTVGTLKKLNLNMLDHHHTCDAENEQKDINHTTPYLFTL